VTQAQAKTIDDEVPALARIAATFETVTEANYTEAEKLFVRLGMTREEVVKHHAPMKEAAFKAHRAVCAQEHKLLDVLDRWITHLRSGLGIVRQRREAERRRIEAELQKQATRAAEDALLAEAEATGDIAALDQPLLVPTVSVAPSQDTAVTYVDTYSAEVTDLAVLVAAIAAGKVPLQAVAANMPFLNTQARALRESLVYPGVRVIKKTDARRRPGREAE